MTDVYEYHKTTEYAGGSNILEPPDKRLGWELVNTIVAQSVTTNNVTPNFSSSNHTNNLVCIWRIKFVSPDIPILTPEQMEEIGAM